MTPRSLPLHGPGQAGICRSSLRRVSAPQATSTNSIDFSTGANVSNIAVKYVCDPLVDIIQFGLAWGRILFRNDELWTSVKGCVCEHFILWAPSLWKWGVESLLNLSLSKFGCYTSNGSIHAILIIFGLWRPSAWCGRPLTFLAHRYIIMLCAVRFTSMCVCQVNAYVLPYRCQNW